MTVYEEAYSATDHDVRFVTTNMSGATLFQGYVDGSTDNWGNPRVANNHVANQFLAVAQGGAAGARVIKGRTFAALDMAFSPVSIVSGPGTTDATVPEVGGDPSAYAPSYYCVVYEDALLPADRHPRANMVDVGGSIFGSTIFVDTSFSTARSVPVDLAEQRRRRGLPRPALDDRVGTPVARVIPTSRRADRLGRHARHALVRDRHHDQQRLLALRVDATRPGRDVALRRRLAASLHERQRSSCTSCRARASSRHEPQHSRERDPGEGPDPRHDRLGRQGVRGLVRRALQRAGRRLRHLPDVVYCAGVRSACSTSTKS